MTDGKESSENPPRRQHEGTKAFRQKHLWRDGIEATMSRYNRLTGVKGRVRWRKAVYHAAPMKATALKIARAVAASKARVRANGANPDRNRGVYRVFRLFKNGIGGIWGSMANWATKKPWLRIHAHNPV